MDQSSPKADDHPTLLQPESDVVGFLDLRRHSSDHIASEDRDAG
jgi:hypothetical protein